MNTKNRYSFITKSTGKLARRRAVATRDEARQIKRDTSFRLSILDGLTGKVIR